MFRDGRFTSLSAPSSDPCLLERVRFLGFIPARFKILALINIGYCKILSLACHVSKLLTF